MHYLFHIHFYVSFREFPVTSLVSASEKYVFGGELAEKFSGNMQVFFAAMQVTDTAGYRSR